MKRYRGDPSGSTNGRGVPNLERALEVSGPPDLEMSSAGALKPEGSEPVLPVFSSRGSPGSQASIAPSLIFGSPEPQLRMAADRCTVGGIVGRQRQLRQSPDTPGLSEPPRRWAPPPNPVSLWARPIALYPITTMRSSRCCRTQGHQHDRAGSRTMPRALIGEDGGMDHQHGSPAGRRPRAPVGPTGLQLGMRRLHP